MPSEKDHLKEASENQSFSKAIESNIGQSSQSGKPNNWIVICEFYTAVHYVDAVLSRSSLHPKNHTERFKRIRHRNAFSSTAKKLYETLYDLSIQSRYHCTQMYQGQVNSSRTARKKLESELPQIP